MIEAGRREGHSVGVTRLAGGRCCDVCKRLSLRVRSIVATSARAKCFSMVVAGLIPSRHRMTGGADVRRGRMSGGLADGGRAVVTGGTKTWGAKKAPAHVARSALHTGMHSDQRKASSRMVEARDTLLCRYGRMRNDAYHAENGE